MFSIFAFNGIVIDRDRESQLSGWLARVQQGRKNINGSGVVILVALMRKLFGAIYKWRTYGSWRHDPVLIKGIFG